MESMMITLGKPWLSFSSYNLVRVVIGSILGGSGRLSKSIRNGDN